MSEHKCKCGKTPPHELDGCEWVICPACGELTEGWEPVCLECGAVLDREEVNLQYAEQYL